jgi:hypothetical protein
VPIEGGPRRASDLAPKRIAEQSGQGLFPVEIEFEDRCGAAESGIALDLKLAGLECFALRTQAQARRSPACRAALRPGAVRLGRIENRLEEADKS